MPRAKRPTTTPPVGAPLHTAVIIPFPQRPLPPASGPLTADIVETTIAFVEGLPSSGLLSHALLTIQVSERFAKPGTGDKSIHAALIALLCLARALDNVGIPVASLIGSAA